MLNGASPMKPNPGSNAVNKKYQNLTFAEILKTNVTDQLYQAAYGIGKRKVKR